MGLGFLSSVASSTFSATPHHGSTSWLYLRQGKKSDRGKSIRSFNPSWKRARKTSETSKRNPLYLKLLSISWTTNCRNTVSPPSPGRQSHGCLYSFWETENLFRGCLLHFQCHHKFHSDHNAVMIEVGIWHSVCWGWENWRQVCLHLPQVSSGL